MARYLARWSTTGKETKYLSSHDQLRESEMFFEKNENHLMRNAMQ